MKKIVALFFVVPAMTLLVLQICRAEGALSSTAESDDELTLKSEFFAEKKTDYVPDRIYEDEEGNAYQLIRWEWVPDRLEARQKEVRRQIDYEAVEREDAIPKKYAVTSQDEITGQTVTGQYPLLDAKAVRQQWTDDFIFQVVFHAYDSDYYELGDKHVPFDAQRPELEGCEEELLAVIGVSPDNYEIMGADWDGEAYMDADGVLCRNAVAFGRKKVTDYEAVYGGAVTYPGVDGFRCSAVYRSLTSLRAPASDRAVISHSVRQPAEDTADGEGWVVIKNTAVVTISLIFLLLCVVLAWLFYRKRRRRANERASVRGLPWIPAVLLFLSLSTAGSAQAAVGHWEKSANGVWRYREAESAEYVRSQWLKDGQDWYHFDGRGNMETGWSFVDGDWYFFCPGSSGAKSGPEGSMVTGWQWIDGRCYYFGEMASDNRAAGAMEADARTPDGYLLSATGAWMGEDGMIVESPGKGFVTIKTDKMDNPQATGAGRKSGSKSSAGRSIKKSGRSKPPESSNSSNSSALLQDTDSSNHTVKGSEAPEAVSPADKINGTGPAESDSSVPSNLPGDSDEPDPATPSEARLVAWRVFFIQKDCPDNELLRPQTGETPEGMELAVDFPEVVIDGDGYEYKAVQSSPYRIVMTGPGITKIYLEYKKEERQPDVPVPDRDVEQRLEQWIEKAAAADELITGQTPTRGQLMTKSAEESNARLSNLVSMTTDTDYHEIYLIAGEYDSPTLTLARLFPDVINLSVQTLEQLETEGQLWSILRVGFSRTYSAADCSHHYETTEFVPAGCLVYGHETSVCDKCKKEKTVILPAKGHRDSDRDGFCDECDSAMRTEDPESRHYSIGDVQIRTIGGREYLFRCIDEDYEDSMGNKQGTALFLCDTVIRSDIDSTSEKFCTIRFGEDNNYKTSRVREWLNENTSQSFYPSFLSYVGVNDAWQGSTKTGSFEQFSEADMKSHRKPFQLMEDQVFLLSVEEAIRYRNDLWNFSGNSGLSQLSAYSKGYYLRSPQYETDSKGVFRYGKGIYAVDLADGMICPVSVDSTSYGMRPAMTVSQG